MAAKRTKLAGESISRKQHLATIRSFLYNKKQHGIPHFVQIGEAVQRFLENGQWKKGDKFGSMKELAEIFGISRLTVKRAMIPFLEKGILKSFRGKGLFMNQNHEEPPLMNLQANWDLHLQISDHSKVEILLNEKVAECPWDMSGFDSLPSSFQHMVRVHEKNGSTYGLIEAYFDSALYDLSPRLFFDETILIAITKLRPNLICSASQTIRIKRANSEAAGHLKIPVGEPVAAIQRRVADKKNRMIYLGNVVYPGDRIQIQVELLIDKQSKKDLS